RDFVLGKLGSVKLEEDVPGRFAEQILAKGRLAAPARPQDRPDQPLGRGDIKLAGPRFLLARKASPKLVDVALKPVKLCKVDLIPGRRLKLGRSNVIHLVLLSPSTRG